MRDRRPSDEILADAWDRALETGIKWAVYGLAAGGALGVLLFRGGHARAGIAGLGSGIGIGMAYADARREFQRLSSGRDEHSLAAGPLTAPEETLKPDRV
jgi:hypothetical protein